MTQGDLDGRPPSTQLAEQAMSDELSEAGTVAENYAAQRNSEEAGREAV